LPTASSYKRMAANPKPRFLETGVKGPSDQDTYDVGEAKAIADWVFNRLSEAATGRKRQTREDQWRSDWKFLSGKQWDRPSPSYRRQITVNVWRRALHILLAVLTGNQPTLKLVPQGPIDAAKLEVWQHALWAVLKRERFVPKYSKALAWALVGDGGWLKIGYGPRGIGSQPDVILSALDPSQVYPDPECRDESLEACSYILYESTLDLSTISRLYPQTGWRVKPDSEESEKSTDSGSGPSESGSPIASSALSPIGGWHTSGNIVRGRAKVIELWIDDPAAEFIDDTLGKRWEAMYPCGRVVTVSRDVVLRDIPNPYETAWGHKHRWPFVFVPGAEHPNSLWRPGLCSDLAEQQMAINKCLSLLLENAIKVTGAIVIGDDNALDDEDWDNLALYPGVKIRKRAGSEFQVVFPQPLPAEAFQLPDYLIKKLEETVGLHDPPIEPGQPIAAKTVAFLDKKGPLLMGEMARLSESALEQLGERIIGLQRTRYLPGRMIPYFYGEKITDPMTQMTWPELPEGEAVRVDATSGYLETMASAELMAQAAAREGKKFGVGTK
jgi:hypothetical protein